MAFITADDRQFQRPACREPIAGLSGNDMSMVAAVGMRMPFVVEQDENGFRCACTRVGQAAFSDGMARDAGLFSVGGLRS
jgi:hypothetical protein